MTKPEQQILPNLPHNKVSDWVFEHGHYLLQIARLHVRTEETAEELVQETFLSAVRALEEFRGESSPRTWLRTILKNKIIDFMRKRARESRVIDRSAGIDEQGLPFNSLGLWNTRIHSWGNDPESALENKDLYKALSSCIAKLPEKFREVFVLRLVDGLSVEEACEVLGASASNVSVMLYRARIQLRECIEKNWSSQ